MEWSMLTQNCITFIILENIQTSIYGHSLRIFKGNAYIFGGTRL